MPELLQGRRRGQPTRNKYPYTVPTYADFAHAFDNPDLPDPTCRRAQPGHYHHLAFADEQRG